MTTDKSNWKYVLPPDCVTVSVEELYKLRNNSAKLAALESANVKHWIEYDYAMWLYNHDQIFKILD